MLLNLYREIYNLENPNTPYRTFRSAWKTLVFIYNYALASMMKIEHPIYIYKNKVYYVLVDKCPVKILTVKHNGKNITNEISKYLGPMENFHGANATPVKIGYDELEFEYLDDDMNIVTKTFKDREVISI